MCPPTGTKVHLTGDACYLKEGKLVDGGTEINDVITLS